MFAADDTIMFLAEPSSREPLRGPRTQVGNTYKLTSHAAMRHVDAAGSFLSAICSHLSPTGYGVDVVKLRSASRAPRNDRVEVAQLVRPISLKTRIQDDQRAE